VARNASETTATAGLWREGLAVLRVDGPLAARLTADAAAALTVLGMAVGLWQGAVEVALFALVSLGQTLLRLAPLRAPVQAVTAALLWAAAVAALVDAYQRIPWLDVVMHLLVTGLLAALGTAAVLRAGWLRPGGPGAGPVDAVRAGRTLLAAGVGTLLAVLWEVGEWFGHTVLDPAIQVGYQDTVGDLAAGVLGALLAGVFLDRLVRAEPHP
jgi:hypothetical protein